MLELKKKQLYKTRKITVLKILLENVFYFVVLKQKNVLKTLLLKQAHISNNVTTLSNSARQNNTHVQHMYRLRQCSHQECQYEYNSHQSPSTDHQTYC